MRRTRRCANSGRNFSTGSSSERTPSSTSTIAPAAPIGLLNDAIAEDGVAWQRRRVTDRQRAERLHVDVVATRDERSQARDGAGVSVRSEPVVQPAQSAGVEAVGGASRAMQPGSGHRSGTLAVAFGARGLPRRRGGLALGTARRSTEGERHGNRTWFVGGQGLRLGTTRSPRRTSSDSATPTPPAGPILALRTADLADKEAVLAAGSRGFFTIPHFDGFSAVLVQLKAATKKPLREASEDAWLACAPKGLSEAFLSGGQT